MLYEAEVEFASDGIWLTGSTLTAGVGFNFEPKSGPQPTGLTAQFAEQVMKDAGGGKDVTRNSRGKLSGALVGQKYESGWKFQIGSAQIIIQTAALIIKDSGKTEVGQGQASANHPLQRIKYLPVPIRTVNETDRTSRTVFIDHSGKIVIPAMAGYANGFSDNLARLITRNSNAETGDYGFIDLEGRLKFKVAAPVGSFSDGLAWIFVTNKIGYIDTEGKIVISPQFDRLDEDGFPPKSRYGREDIEWDPDQHDFHEGFALVSTASGRGYIDKTGKLAIGLPTVKNERSYPKGWNRFSDGVAAFQQETVDIRYQEGKEYRFTNSLYGYIDRTGKTVIAPVFYRAFPFVDGIALVNSGEKTNGIFAAPLFIGKTGKSLFAPEWDEAEPFAEGLAAVRKKGERFSYINTSGKTVFTTRSLVGAKFSEGFATIQTEDGCGFIDKQGRIVIKPQFRWANRFQNGLAESHLDDRIVWVNPAGIIVSSIPNPYRRVGQQKPSKTCAQNLSEIDENKFWWIQGNKESEFVKTNGVPDLADLSSLRLTPPQCPNGGVYSFGDRNMSPRCSIDGGLAVK